MRVRQAIVARMTVKMPKVGDSVDTVTIVEWDKAVGDRVDSGEVLLRVETDKAIVEVPSPVSGVVLEVLAEVDADVNSGTPIAIVDGSGD